MKAQHKDATWTTEEGDTIRFTTRYKGLINNFYWFRENCVTVLLYNGAKISEGVDEKSNRLLEGLHEAFVALNKAQLEIDDCDTQRQENAIALLKSL